MAKLKFLWSDEAIAEFKRFDFVFDTRQDLEKLPY